MILALVIIAAIAAIVVTIFFIILKGKQDELEERFQRRFSGRDIRYLDKYALYVAKESDGHSHLRGTGNLVLTQDELYFEGIFIKEIITIPTRSILKVEETMRLGGQSPGQPMLKVTFKTKEGKTDAIAWKVTDVERWIEEISDVMLHQT